MLSKFLVHFTKLSSIFPDDVALLYFVWFFGVLTSQIYVHNVEKITENVSFKFNEHFLKEKIKKLTLFNFDTQWWIITENVSLHSKQWINIKKKRDKKDTPTLVMRFRVSPGWWAWKENENEHRNFLIFLRLWNYIGCVSENNARIDLSLTSKQKSFSTSLQSRQVILRT